MPFTKYLEDHTFSPDTVKAMSEALTKVCRELEAAGISQYSTSALVQTITALAAAGETDPERLSRAALQAMRSQTKAIARPLQPT
jgi:hypothetical protein